MPEQELEIPVRPRCEHGHLWFDRERSTRDCQTEVCPACGLVRLTSNHTGQVAGYAECGAGGGALPARRDTLLLPHTIYSVHLGM